MELLMNASECITGACDLNQIPENIRGAATGMFQSYPGMSLMMVFGVGVGIGALLGEVMPSRAFRSETSTERIGRQICEALHINPGFLHR
jgi:hypothetical protein